MITLLIVKVTVTLAVAFGAVWISRRSRAAVRHSLLAAAFAVIALLPVASMILPAINLVTTHPVQPFPIATTHAPTGSAIVVGASHSEVSFQQWMMAGWIVGAMFFLTPMAAGLWKVRALRRSAAPWSEGFAGDRRVEVLLHPSLAGPMTFGFVRPVVILPDDAAGWDGDDLDRALDHELEHVRRGDWLTHCLVRSICALYWFHPLVWIARWRLELEAERSCDDAVLGMYEATAYADQLVALAQRLSSTSKSAQLAMANRADLAARVGAVLDGGQRRGRLGKAALTVAIIGAVAFVAAVSPLRVAAAPQEVTSAKFSSKTKLVIVDVVVKDKDGAPIEGLHASDFALTEDGVAEPISTFEFQKVEGSLSSYYILGYYTAKENMDGKFRRVHIAVDKSPTAKVDYRAGYYINPAQNAVAVVNVTANSAVSPPSLLYKVDPEYSEEARKAKYSGTVLLSIVVDATGHVETIKVIKSLGLGLDEKAMAAVAKWRFRPGTKDGQPIAVQTQVEVDFRLL